MVVSIEAGTTGEGQRGSSTVAIGSGLLLSKEGLILTANHLIRGLDSYRIVFWDGRVTTANLIATDAETDLAVVKADTDFLNQMSVVDVPLATTAESVVGNWVIAIGSPFGLSHSVTAGIISARARSASEAELDIPGFTDSHYGLIQTDAPLNPGNSGGPLFNACGALVGINIAMNPGGQRLGFAIASDTIGALLPFLMEGRKYKRSWLGVRAGRTPAGIVVDSVEGNSPAARGGLVHGDVLTGLNGIPLTSVQQLRGLVAFVGPTKSVNLSFRSKSQALNRQILLDSADSLPRSQSSF